MKQLLKINFISSSFFAFGWLLAFIGFPYLLYIIGLVIFLLPGLHLALTLEQITERQGRIKLALWTVLFSLLITPIFIYGYLHIFDKPIEQGSILFAFLILWAITLAVTTFFSLWNKALVTPLTLPKYTTSKPLYIALTILLVVFGVHFLLYPYIPEADPYYYLDRLDFVNQNHIFPPGETRPLFLFSIFVLSSITKIPAYWIFKIILSLMLAPLVIITYNLSKTYIKETRLLIVSSLSFLLFPVIIIEGLIPRPQSFFLVALSIILYLISDLLKITNYRNYYWFAAILTVSAIGLTVHPFFIFALILTLVGLIIFSLPLFRRHLPEGLFIVLIISIITYPLMQDLGLIKLGVTFLDPFINAIKHPRFDPWFIDSYINVDGNEVGWPGISTLYYYGYNLGFAILILAGWNLLKVRRIAIRQKDSTVFWVGLIIFASIAEIYPRLGLAYLPDRAWLFVALILSFFAPAFWTIFNKTLPKYAPIIASLILLTSICIGWYVTYSKQGWVSPGEYRFIQQVKKITPKDSVIVSQSSNTVLIGFFGNRQIAIPKKVIFDQPDSIEANEYFYSISNPKEKKLTLTEEINITQEKMNAELNKYQTAETTNERLIALEKYYELAREYETLITAEDKLGQTEKTRPKPVYILYSKQKFSNLYSTRSWWRDTNFYDANLQKINDAHELILEKDGIFLWKVSENVWDRR